MAVCKGSAPAPKASLSTAWGVPARGAALGSKIRRSLPISITVRSETRSMLFACASPPAQSRSLMPHRRTTPSASYRTPPARGRFKIRVCRTTPTAFMPTVSEEAAISSFYRMHHAEQRAWRLSLQRRRRASWLQHHYLQLHEHGTSWSLLQNQQRSLPAQRRARHGLWQQLRS